MKVTLPSKLCVAARIQRSSKSVNKGLSTQRYATCQAAPKGAQTVEDRAPPASNREPKQGNAAAPDQSSGSGQGLAQTTSPRESSTGYNIAPPFNVVITGGSRGLGRALATRFLQVGDTVVICSKQEESVDQATAELRKEFGGDRVHGVAANVARPEDVARLSEYIRGQLGRVDIWVNNAGSNAYRFDMLVDSSEQDLVSIVETNVLGTMLCCRAAIALIRDQGTPGHIFNMDGAGSNGRPTPRFAAYGATKRGLVQLGKSLEAELKMLGIDNVGVHNLSPGMVTTDLLMAGSDTQVAKFFINCLAERPTTVADYLVPRVRKVPQEAATLTGGIAMGTYIQFLTPPKAFTQIFGRALLGLRKNRWVNEG